MAVVADVRSVADPPLVRACRAAESWARPPTTSLALEVSREASDMRSLSWADLASWAVRLVELVSADAAAAAAPSSERSVSTSGRSSR